MNYILYDGSCRESLLPFTYTKPVADIRVGILTIREKWEKFLRLTTTTLTEEYLSNKYPMLELDENIFINAGCIPNEAFFKAVASLKKNEKVICNGEIIAFFTTIDQEEIDLDTYQNIEINGVISIQNKWDLFVYNALAIDQDFELLTKEDVSMDVPEGVQVINKKHVFIEEGATIFPCILNATDGPIYIGKDSTILDGAMIRGPFALGEKSLVKMGAKIYGATTVGPNCKIGGEIKNSIMFANSNKGHDGYLGNSVIGEWCNFGANSNVSNLKNTLSSVHLWNYEEDDFENTDEMFCGLMMGDYSKTAVNTMFNTGTVVGVSANVFGTKTPDKHVVSFVWRAAKKNEIYSLDKAIETAIKTMGLAKTEMSEEDKIILEEVFRQTIKYRNKIGE